MKINNKNAIDIFNSSSENCYQEIKEFIENGGDLSMMDERSGWTLLHFCAECWQPEVMELLISNGANINVLDSQGWSPLHLSVDSEIDGAIQADTEINFIMTKILIDKGANLDLRNNDKETPRDIAKAYGVDIVNKFDKLIIGYRDREEPRSSPLPHHAAYGSVLRGSADQAESDPGGRKTE